MSKFAILRTAKLKTFGNIGASLSHTYRTRATQNADPTRAGENRHLVRTADEAMENIKARLPEKKRKNAVLAVEYFIGCSPNAFPNRKGYQSYFNDALQWLRERHGRENVAASSLHFDETTPHMVAYVVPIDERGRLNASRFLDGRKCLSEMQTDFAVKVGAKHSLERGIEGSPAKHTEVKDWYAMVNQPITPIEIPPQSVLPKIKKKRFLAADEVETSSEVATRLSNDINRQTAPALEQAKMANHYRESEAALREMIKKAERERKEAEARAEQAKSEAEKMHNLYASLTPTEKKKVKEWSNRNKEIQRRIGTFTKDLHCQLDAHVRRLVSKIHDAAMERQGRYWEVQWRDMETDYLASEMPLIGPRKAVEAVLTYSPGTGRGFGERSLSAAL